MRQRLPVLDVGAGVSTGRELDWESSRHFVTAMQKSHGRALRLYLARRMRHSAADIPDLCQEVFLRLLRVPDHESIRNPQAYLFTIASHLLQEYALRRAAASQPVDPGEVFPELEASTHNDPAEDVLLEQRFEQLGKGLEQYSPRAYVTLLLYRCEGLTLDEIGKRLGVSKPMARKYLIKAMTYCQQRLDELE